MLDEVAPEILVVAAVFTALVCGLMVIVWFVSMKDDKVKSKDDDKEADGSGKIGKKKRQHVSPRKKKESTIGGVKDEGSDSSLDTPKSILKEHKNEPSPRSRPQHVEFHKETVTEPKPVSHVNPSTPHPQAGSITLSTDEEPKPKPTAAKEPKKAPPTNQPSKPTQTSVPSQKTKPISKPPTETPAAAEHSTNTSTSTKKKPKTKQGPTNEDLSSMSGTCIADAISGSSLSKEEVEEIMNRLLEKKDLDEEWEMTNRTESVKVLKKNNAELQSRCSEAEKANQRYTERIKGLSADLRQEKTRHSTAEASLQNKFAKVQEDYKITKERLEQSLKDLQLLKETDSAVEVKKLKEENNSYQTQLAQFAQQKSQMTAEMNDKMTEVTTLNDTITQLQKDLKTSRSSQSQSKQSQEKIKELQNLLEKTKLENDQLQKEVMGGNNERGKLLADLNDEKETVRNLQQQLELAQKGPVKEEVTVVMDTNLAAAPPTNDEDKIKINNLQSELKQAKDALEAAKTEKAKSDDVSQQLKTTLASREEDVRRNQVELARLQKENEGLKTSRQPLEDELEKVKENLKTEVTKSQTLQSQLDTMSNGVDKEPSIDDDEKVDLEELEMLREEKRNLHRKIAEIQNKNDTLRDNCFDAQQNLETMKNEYETKLHDLENSEKTKLADATEKALTDQQRVHKEFFQRLFPSINVDEDSYDDWRQKFHDEVKEQLANKDRTVKEKDDEIDELSNINNESTEAIQQLKKVLSDTSEKFNELMAKWQEKESEYDKMMQKEMELRERLEEELKQAQIEKNELTEKIESLKIELENANKATDEYHRRFSETDRITLVTQQETETLRHSLVHEINIKEKFEAEVEELKNRIEELDTKLLDITEAKTLSDKRAQEATEKLTSTENKLTELETVAQSLREANQDLHSRLFKLSSPPPQGTSSEV